MESKLTPQQLEQVAILLDPVKFAKSHFNWEARWYQAEILNGTHTHRRIVTRCGRRVGKTETMCVHMLWYSFTHENSVCLIAAPYENQIKLVFRKLREFIGKSDVIKAAIQSNTKNPEFIQFKNGSIIQGFTAGTRGGNEGASIRGQRADWIYLDKHAS